MQDIDNEANLHTDIQHIQGGHTLPVYLIYSKQNCTYACMQFLSYMIVFVDFNCIHAQAIDLCQGCMLVLAIIVLL